MMILRKEFGLLMGVMVGCFNGDLVQFDIYIHMHITHHCRDIIQGLVVSVGVGMGMGMGMGVGIGVSVGVIYNDGGQMRWWYWL